MLEIKHKDTGEVLSTIDADTLAGADLRDMRLAGADLRGADLRRAQLEYADLVGADLRNGDQREFRRCGAGLGDHGIRQFLQGKKCPLSCL